MFARPHIALLIALLAAVGINAASDRLDPYFLDIILSIGINIILAVSLNLINGYTGQFSLGHAGFMAVGAYTASAFSMFLGPKLLGGPLSAASGAGVWGLFLAALVTGGVTAAVSGLVVGAPSLRLKGDYLAIVTLGFGEIIRVIFQNTEALGGALGLNGIPSLTNFFWVYAFAALSVYCVVTLVDSTYGRGFIAVHDDEIAAEAMGINTTKYKIVAFLVGAFFAGVAGGLYSHFKLSIDPRGFDFTRSIEIVVMVILGGMGSTLGVVIAAVLLTLLPQGLILLSEQSVAIPGLGTYGLAWIKNTRMVIYSLLLVALMLGYPGGLARAGRWFKERWNRRSA